MDDFAKTERRKNVGWQERHLDFLLDYISKFRGSLQLVGVGRLST
jgi:hypothetical protein